MRLNRMSSQDIVCELIHFFGESRTMDVLRATRIRMKAFSSGRGCLTDEQLERISNDTGKSWMRWSVEGGARHARSADQHKLVAMTRKMLDEIDSPRQKRVSRPRSIKPQAPKIVSRPRRQAV